MKRRFERYFYCSVLISLILHAGLLMLFMPLKTENAANRKDQVIEIDLIDESFFAESSIGEKQRENLSPTPPRLPEEKSLPEMQNQSQTLDSEVTVYLDDDDKPYSPYLLHVRKLIDSSWIYPAAALQNGLQGELTLFFSIEKKGTLTDIRLVHSSEHSVLDSAAVKAVNDAAPFMPIPDRLKIDKMNIFASFVYRYD